jgi:hypothetical protein
VNHNNAGAQLGVVFLNSPVEKGRACDFKKLESLAGTTIPQQPSAMPEYKPAKEFAIDVTGTVKAIARGEEKFNGLALRIVPDRGIDDGWTVHCLISSTDGANLEVDRFADDIK